MKRLWDYFGVSARVSLNEQLAFRSNFWLGILYALIRVLMLLALWSALYQNHESINGINLPTMKLYTVASIIFEVFISSEIEKSVTSKIRDGSISMVMTRPASYPVTIVIEQLAFTVQNVVLRVLPYALMAWVSGIGAGARVQLTPALVLSAALAYLLMLFFQMFFGMIAFWTMEIDGILQVRNAVMLVFSGSMVPLWFFPDWLFDIARFLPFQAIYNVPLSILIGKLEGRSVWDALLVQAVWLAFFFALSMLFWGKSKRRVVVNGG